jgi:hypothetical protein
LLFLNDPDPESGHFILSYVDDTAICTQSRSLDDNVEWLIRQYTRWKLAFDEFGLVLEDSKTELFHCRAHQTHLKYKPLYKGPLPPINIEGSTGSVLIQPSQKWRYLGYIFDPCLNFHHHIKWCVNKAHGTIRAMRMLGNSV